MIRKGIMEMRKKFFSVILALVVVVSLISINVYATSKDGIMVDKLLRTEIEPLNVNELRALNDGKDICIKTIEEDLSNLQNDESFYTVNVDTDGISLMASEKVVDKSLTDPNGSQSVRFDLTSDMTYYKVWIDNTSSRKYNVTVTYKTSTGDVIEEFTVGAGKRVTKYYEGKVGLFSSKTRYVNITSTDGSALSGTVAVRIASTLGELQ